MLALTTIGHRQQQDEPRDHLPVDLSAELTLIYDSITNCIHLYSLTARAPDVYYFLWSDDVVRSNCE